MNKNFNPNDKPENAVFLFGFNTKVKNWDQYREKCYQDLRKNYGVYIVKFDIGRNAEGAFVHFKTRDMAEKLKGIGNYTDPKTNEKISRLRLANTNIVVYPYIHDRNKGAVQKKRDEIAKNEQLKKQMIYQREFPEIGTVPAKVASKKSSSKGRNQPSTSTQISENAAPATVSDSPSTISESQNQNVSQPIQTSTPIMMNDEPGLTGLEVRPLYPQSSTITIKKQETTQTITPNTELPTLESDSLILPSRNEVASLCEENLIGVTPRSSTRNSLSVAYHPTSNSIAANMPINLNDNVQTWLENSQPQTTLPAPTPQNSVSFERNRVASNSDSVMTNAHSINYDTDDLKRKAQKVGSNSPSYTLNDSFFNAGSSQVSYPNSLASGNLAYQSAVFNPEMTSVQPQQQPLNIINMGQPDLIHSTSLALNQLTLENTFMNILQQYMPNFFWSLSNRFEITQQLRNYYFNDINEFYNQLTGYIDGLMAQISLHLYNNSLMQQTSYLSSSKAGQSTA